ncbi:MAG: SMC-Scp complex subunit ScpB [Fuerstiella sp.]
MAEETHEPTIDNDDPPVDDIELAYREALKSIDEAEYQVGSALRELSDDTDEESDEDEEAAFTSIGRQLADDLTEEESALAAVPLNDPESLPVSPRAVIEAALFVGGNVSLTARRLASLIGNDTDARLSVRMIDQLNESYATENRPYEIRLHEGGFRLQLKEQYANVQLKVFGLGPREVRLSPETLEVLAFIAYNQPVDKKEVGELSQRNALVVLRQLLRLRLVELERTGSRRSDVTYRTGQRFLDLFGLNDLTDLPQADVFSFK